MIHFFGDSFTYGQGCTPDHEYYQRTYNGIQKTWVELTSDYINDDYINYGKPGISNQRILDIIIENMHRIDKNDIVIICRGTDSRFSIPYSYPSGKPRYYHILLNMFMENLYPEGDFTKEYHTSVDMFIKNIWVPNLEIVSERFDTLYNGIKLNFETNNIKTLLWNLEDYLLDENGSPYYSIISEEFPDINDSHWSWKGHTQFFNKIKLHL